MHWGGKRCRPVQHLLLRECAFRPLLFTSYHPIGGENQVARHKVSLMCRFLAVAILSSMAFAQLSSSAGSKSVRNPAAQPASGLDRAFGGPPDLPPMPRGKSTVIGGSIGAVDRVRDQLTLNVFGGRKLKVLFDERTQVYRDGQKTALRDLRAGDHVSVETVLDGTTVFARSIHMLSELPEGECQGQVVNYNPTNHELTLRDALSSKPVKLRVPAGTAVVRLGQAASSSVGIGSSDLAIGTLISVTFQSDNKGHGVASQIAILAAPGTAFVFVGNVASLDVHSGRLVVVDPRDDKRYEVFFDFARFPVSRDLHEGTDVTVTAKFDGARYVATAITVATPAIPEK